MPMDRKQLRHAIRKASTVYGWVSLHAEDGAYIQLTKQSLLASIANDPDHLDIGYNADMRNSNDLYIN